ncbi:ImmA/IrrE family metallo-endopeptidase [Vagococcus xieshaowenii]|uniref:ImmA/IrrE family metallo-endopeptidase n=1 Tax=Vagococcus xieshaowenii TaxID=2562451 RepID=A0A4Z0DAE8_9ENTE|nr:ImmA/IrrE family metallo-endopeptidase [Vagococcus xieshaowenii]QCA28224.1 ImmA/IrrE family metallo-endopeptidase [Vagococcus xieshaowenii]TFZ41879.1 ImmA/IrrE family metallo-endopeptidase [Vagococcus xieshaowenii]
MHKRLKEILEDNNLELFFSKMDRAGFYYPKAQAVVLNEALQGSPEANFAAAHEIGHHLAEHVEFNALCSNYIANSKLEHEANKIAINILLSIYVEDYGSIEMFNIERFMSFYRIKSNLLDLCEKECLNFFKQKEVIYA